MASQAMELLWVFFTEVRAQISLVLFVGVGGGCMCLQGLSLIVTVARLLELGRLC